MNAAVRCLRALGVFAGGVGVLVFAVQTVRSDPQTRPRPTKPSAAAEVPQTIPDPTTPAMAALRAKGLARIDELEAKGTIDREDTDELKRIHRGLDLGGKMALAAAFGDAFASERIHVDNPHQLPF